MSGPLALAGDQPLHADCTHETELLALAGSPEVLVLPTAAAYEAPKLVAEAAARRFGDLGAEVRTEMVLQRSDAEEESRAAAVRAARFIYLLGDSPMHLRSVLKGTAVWSAIVEAWDGGATLLAAGGSAMALSDPMVDPRGGAFTVGLGLVGQMAVVAQSSWSPDQARRTIVLAPKGIPVVGVDGHAALVRSSEGTWRRAGSGEVVVYADGAETDLSVLPG